MISVLRTPVLSLFLGSAIAATLIVPAPVHAACGCMMRRRPPPKTPVDQRAKIVNKSSKVAIVRDGDRTVMTMANDVNGDIREFALIVPVPTVITKDMVKVADHNVFAELEDVTAPKLKEIIDPVVCPQDPKAGATADGKAESAPMATRSAKKARPRAKDFGIKVEAHFKVGEYDIAILKAKESDGLIKWLRLFKYDVPDEAAAVLTSYIKQGMRFFVTRVDLGKQKREGFTMLRPLQVAYETPKFMLPIRLGMVNADGPQELMVYAISRRGRVEPTNYRAVKMPSDLEFPYFVKAEFNKLYEAGFTHQTNVNEMKAVFVEYVGPAWRMLPGDPWTMAPPTKKGVNLARLDPDWNKVQGSKEGYVTRMHFRYDQANFPEDLTFQLTDDTARFSVNYTVRKERAAWETQCKAGEEYRRRLPARHERQAKTLAGFAGMERQAVRKRMGLPEQMPADVDELIEGADEPAQAESMFNCSTTGDRVPASAFALIALSLWVRRRRR